MDLYLQGVKYDRILFSENLEFENTASTFCIWDSRLACRLLLNPCFTSRSLGAPRTLHRHYALQCTEGRRKAYIKSIGAGRCGWFLEPSPTGLSPSCSGSTSRRTILKCLQAMQSASVGPEQRRHRESHFRHSPPAVAS